MYRHLLLSCFTHLCIYAAADEQKILLVGSHAGWNFTISVPYTPELTIADLKHRVADCQDIGMPAACQQLMLIRTVSQHSVHKKLLDDNTRTLADYGVRGSACIRVIYKALPMVCYVNTCSCSTHKRLTH